MLAFLLDEQISPVVAAHAAIPIQTIHRWHDGALCGRGDALVLEAARHHRLTLVTYDLKTIPPLLAEWAASGISHAGAVLVDDRTIAPSDFGGILAALTQLWRSEKHAAWRDRVHFLTRDAESG